MKITITVNVERKNKTPKTETESGPDIRVGTGGFQSVAALPKGRSNRVSKLGFHA